MSQATSALIRLGALLALCGALLTPTAGLAATAVDDGAGAHAAVVADGAPFDGWRSINDGLIGLAQYWEASPIPGDSADWAVVYTYGWGDCQAGCIDRHTWSFTVKVDGTVTYIGESGPELPADAPAALRAYPDLPPSPAPSPSDEPAPVTPSESGSAPLLPLALLGLGVVIVAAFGALRRRR